MPCFGFAATIFILFCFLVGVVKAYKLLLDQDDEAIERAMQRQETEIDTKQVRVIRFFNTDGKSWLLSRNV